jgi:hypothetical protein
MKYIVNRVEVTVSEVEVEGPDPVTAQRYAEDDGTAWEHVSHDLNYHTESSGQADLRKYLEAHNVDDETLEQLFGRGR